MNSYEPTDSIKNNISYNDLCKALKLWVFRLDGYDGAIGGIYGEIPWSNEMERILRWDYVEHRFSDVIPECPSRDRFSLTNVVCGDRDEIDRLNAFVATIANDIFKVYKEVFDEMIELTKKRVIVEKAVGVENGLVKYSVDRVFYSNTWLGCFQQVVNAYKDIFAWDDEKMFIDTCYKSLPPNYGSVHIGLNYYLRFK